jgi:hypothetical protein
MVSVFVDAWREVAFLTHAFDDIEFARTLAEIVARGFVGLG